MSNTSDGTSGPSRPAKQPKPRAVDAGAVPMQLPAVLESMSDGFVAIGRDWRYTYVNAAAAGFLRRPAGQLVGTSIFEAFPEVRGTTFEKGFRQALEQNVATTFKAYYPPLEAWFECRCHPSPDGISVFFTDITQRKHAEEALPRNERLARSRLREIETIYNSAHVGLCVFDRKLRYIRINERLAEIDGLPAADHIGRTVREVVPDLADMAEELAERIFRTGEPVLNVELSGVTAARPGVLRHWVEHWLPLKSDSGRISGINVVVHDVTEQREAENRLAYLASFPQRNLNPIMEADLDGGIRFMNPAAMRLFPDLAELGISHPWLANWGTVTASFREGRTGTDVRDVTVGGRTYQQAFYYSSEEGFVRIYGFDITGRKQAEMALQAANGQLQVQTEELQAQGEELQTQTEELRAQAEELTAANEELQAQWEELQTQAEELRKTEQALRRLNEELEQRVAERTADLSRANDALRRAGAYNRSLIEASLDPLVTIGPDGKITDVNAATEAATGQTGGELIGTDFSDYFTEPAKAQAGYQQVFQDGFVRDYPLEIRHTDGGVTPVLYNASVYRDEGGDVIGIFAAARNVTKLRRAEQMRVRLAAIVESSDDAIIGKNLDGVITSWNKGARRIYGYTAEEAIGQSVSLLAQGGSRKEIEPILERIRQNETVDHYETVRVTKDGRPIHVSLTISGIRDETGRVMGASTIARDISERKRAEEAVRRAGVYNRSLIEASLDPLVTIGPDGKITDVNAATEAATGCTREELIGTDFSDYFTEPAQAQAGYQQVFRDGLVRDYPLEIRHKDGRLTPVLYNASVYRDEEGEVIGVFAAARDVTELRRAERAVRAERHRFNDVLETLPAYLMLLTPDYHVPFANRFFRERFGESHGRRCFEYLFGRTGPCEVCDTYKVLKTNAPHHWGWTGPDGRNYDVYDFPFTDTDGSPLIMEMGIDITDQKHAEAELVKHRDHLEELVRERTSQLEAAEQKLAKENREIALANRVLQVFVEETGDDLFDKALHIVLEAMDSRHGVFGYIDENGDLVCPSMSKLLDACEVADKCIRYPQGKWKGLWSRALRKKKTLYTNQAPVVPNGHVPIRNNLAAPILFQGRAIGLLNLANKEADYTEADCELIGSIANRVAPVLYAWVQRELHENDRKQMETELRRWNEQLEARVAERTEQLTRSIDRLQDEMTRRVLAEGKLRKNSRMLEGFFQHTITPLAFLDRRFNFVRVNDAYARANARDPKYFPGKDHFELYPHEENQAIFEQVVRTKQPYRAYAKPFTYPDNPQRVTYWDWQLTPLLSEFGDVQFLVLNLADVTEQQKAFGELERRARQLQHLTLELSQAEDRERRRLAEILHDDLQQMLAAAKFHLGILSNCIKDNESAREIAGQISQMLREAIDQSRSLSHELSPAVLYEGDLSETFEWLAQQVQSKHGLTVHVEAHGRIESRSDALRAFLYRTAQEMLFNVVKHAKAKEARLRLRRVRGRIWMTISDQGRGFDPKALSRSAGFGLLSIRERVELLGGRMKIRSAAGRGSTFLIAVPDPEAAREAERETVGATPRGRPMPGRHGGLPLRVLLVDDHEVMREGLAILLGEQEDMEIVGQAGNGREAVELASRLAPDVVVMDASMPVMAGDEATRQIKRLLPGTRIIGLSMFEEAQMARKMRKAGAEIYLLKTAPSEQLLAAIRGKH